MRCSQCPRCGDHTLESYKTHSYCLGCNYSNITFAKERNPQPKGARVKDQDAIVEAMLEASFTPF